MPHRLDARAPDFEAAFAAFLDAQREAQADVAETVAGILAEVRARGDAAPDSDWDLLILLDGPMDWRRAETATDWVYDVEQREETCPVLSTIVHGREVW